MKTRKIGYEICHCSRLIRRYMDTIAVKSRADEVTGAHSWALGYLYHNRSRDVFQRDLEKEFDIRRSTASNMLSLMEKNGLIIRQSVPGDARLKRIELTQKAVQIHLQVDAALEKMEKDLAADISPAELESFFATADKIVRNIERMSTEND